MSLGSKKLEPFFIKIIIITSINNYILNDKII